MYHLEKKIESQGENITLNNTAKTPFEVFKVTGNSVQETRSGKNLVNINSNDIVNSNIVANVDNNSLILEGDTNGNFYCAIPINLKTNTNYHISFLATIIEQNNLELSPYVRVRTDISGSWIGSRIVINKDLTTQQSLEGSFNSGDNTTAYLILYLNAVNDGTQRSAKIKFDNLQVEEGTQATDYEQYGAMPSPEFISKIENVEGSVNEFDVSQEPTAISCTKKGDIENGYWYQGNENTTQIYASSRGWLVLPFDFEANKDYMLSFKIRMITLGNSAYVRVQTHNNFTALQIVPITNEFKKVEVPINIENADNVLIALNSNEVQITDIKIEQGTKATEYSPYGYGNVNVTVCNKNLFTGFIKGKGLVSSTGEEKVDDKSGTSDFIQVNFDKNESYCISGLTDTISSFVAFYNKNKEYLGRNSGSPKTSMSFNSNSYVSMAQNYESIKDKNIRFIRVTQYEVDNSIGTIDDIDNLQVQLETGSTNTDYVEHQEQTVTFPLAQGQKLMLGDYLAADGIHHVRKQIELDGTDFSLYSNQVAGRTIYMISAFSNNNNFKTYDSSILCNILKQGTSSNGNNYLNNNASSGSLYVSIENSILGITNESTNEEKLEAFQNLIAETGFVYEGELAEEETEAYTEEQQEAYNQINSLYSYDEVTNIFSNNEISPIFDVSTFKMITEEFKQRLLNGKITRAYLKVLATDTQSEFTIDENNYLKDLTFEELRYIPEEGFIGGTVAKRVTGNFNNIDNSFSIQDREFELYMGVDLEDETTEYIKYGTYIVQKPEDDQVNDNTSFEALDYMIKLNLPWVDRMTYPCTLKELFDDLVAQSGLSTKVTSFLNQDFIVENNQFEEGTARRDVLKAIAQMAFNWARIDEDNDIVMDFEKKDEVAETLTADNYYNFKKQDMYGPINVIVLRNSQVEGENITIRDEESIAQYGETELVISDNPFAYTQAKRAELIEAGRILFGLTYIPMSMDMIGYIYLNCKDKIRATNLNNEKFDTYLLNHTIEYTGVVSDSMESPANTKTETKYQFTPDMIKALKRTEILVDKANQQIQQIVEEQTNFSKKVSNLTVGLNSITSEVHNFYEFTKEVSGINEILLEDALNMDILKFEAKAKTIRGIYPRQDLYPSPNLYPKKGGTTITLVFGRTSRDVVPEPILPSKTLYPSSTLYPRSNGYYKSEFQFYVKNPLRNYLNLNDRFIVELDQEKGICIAKVIRYIDVNELGEYIVLDTPQEEIIEEKHLPLFEGNNYVYIKEVRDWDISATYVFNNELNKDYALRVETNSKIKTVADEINLEVSKKVNQDEIIASINLSPEEIKILAKNLQLEGFTSINGNFTIDEEGNMICKNATIDGAAIVNGEKFSVDEKGNLKCNDATMNNATINNATMNTTTCNDLIIKNSTIREGNIELKSTGGNSSFSVIDTSNDRINSELSAMLLNFNSNEIRNACMLGIIQNTGAGFVSVEGDIDCNVLHQNSLESIKKNIEKFSGGLELVKKSDIYTYNFKVEDDTNKKHIGFVIGDNYKTPEEVLGQKGVNIELYSMISILWNAVQEQQEEIEILKGGN